MNENHSSEHDGRIIHLEKLTNLWVEKIIRKLEETWKPKTIEELTKRLEFLLSKNIHYDALNYAIYKNYDALWDAWIWIGKIPEDKIKLSKEQKTILIQQLELYLTQAEWDFIEALEQLLLYLKNNDISWFIRLIKEYPSIQKRLEKDEVLWTKWSKYYRTLTLDKILEVGIWNCKTYWLLSKAIIASGSKKWNLWVSSVDMHENIDGHVVLWIYTGKSITVFDPLKPLYTDKDNL
jgi:hypothetical protein